MGRRGGIDWCQWTASRRVDFENWLKAQGGADYQNDDANYGFLLSELRGSQAGGIRALSSPSDLGGAGISRWSSGSRAEPEIARLTFPGFCTLGACCRQSVLPLVKIG